MKPDEFEQRLSRQPLRPVPAEWRAEILAAMRRGEETPRCGVGPRSVPSLPAWLATLFWPRPAAWAGLAVVWIFIFALNFSMRDHTPALAEKVAPPSPVERMIEPLGEEPTASQSNEFPAGAHDVPVMYWATAGNEVLTDHEASGEAAVRPTPAAPAGP